MPTALYERWSMDFMRDTLEDGRPFRILTIVDGHEHAPPTKGGAA